MSPKIGSASEARFLRARAAKLLAFDVGRRIAASEVLALDCSLTLRPEDGTSCERPLRGPSSTSPPRSISASVTMAVEPLSPTATEPVDASLFAKRTVPLRMVSDLGTAKVTFVEPT